MAPSLFEPDRGEPFNIVCLITYETSKASRRMPAAQGDSTAAFELRDDLSRLRIPLIKTENVRQYKASHDTLELWWWSQRGYGPLHNTLEKVLCHQMDSYDLEDMKIQHIALFYLPERVEYLPSSWKPWWQLSAPTPLSSPPSYSGGLSPAFSTLAPVPSIPAPSAHGTWAPAPPPSSVFTTSFAPPLNPGITHTASAAAVNSPLPALGIRVTELQNCFRLLDGNLSGLDELAKRNYLEKLRPLFEDGYSLERPSLALDSPFRIRDAVLSALYWRAERASKLEAQSRGASDTHRKEVLAAETRTRDIQSQLESERREHANLRSKCSMLSAECEDTKSSLSESHAASKRLAQHIRSLQTQFDEFKAKLSANEEARVAAQTKQEVAEAKLAVERSKHEDAESKLTSLLREFAKQESAISASLQRNERLQGDLSRIEDERRKEQEAHAGEKESWQAEKARMRAELDAMRAEQAKPFVTPALLNAFVGINDMVRLATS